MTNNYGTNRLFSPLGLLAQPLDESANVDSPKSSSQVSPVYDAKDLDLSSLRPENRPVVAGLDFPEVVPAELLHLAGRPRGLLEERKVLKDLTDIALRKGQQVALGAGGIDEIASIHGAV